MTYQPQVAREMLPIEAAWVGAMVEGDGSFGVYPRASQHGYMKLSVNNTEVETIATLLRLTGAGGISVVDRETRYHRRHHKANWQWQVGRRADVVAILRQIAPFHTGKQDRALALVQDNNIL